jgi:hypothetical protein
MPMKDTYAKKIGPKSTSNLIQVTPFLKMHYVVDYLIDPDTYYGK